MSDFADGIAPKRYPCQRKICKRRAVQKPESKPVEYHWSLDNGRWVRESQDGAVAKDDDCTVSSDAKPPVELRKERNPFVAFKRVAKSAWQGLFFPPATESMNEPRQYNKQDSQARWTGQQNNHDASKTPRSDAVKAALLLMRLAESQTLHITPERIDALFRDEKYAYNDPTANAMLAFGGACYFLPEIGDRLPGTSLFHPPQKPPRWLSVEWFKTSPYSPVQIEAIEDLPGPREKWRAAFEDLMTVSLGAKREQREQRDDSRHSVWREPGVDWMLSLLHRGILPPLLPRAHSTRWSGVPSVGSHHDFNTLVDEMWMNNRSGQILKVCEKKTQSVFSPVHHPCQLDQMRQSMRPTPPTGLQAATANGAGSLDSPGHSSPPDLTRSASLASDRCIGEYESAPGINAKPLSPVRSSQRTSETKRMADGTIAVRTTVKKIFVNGTEEEHASVERL